MKILIVKLSALGDVVQALAVLPALKAGLPQARLYWAVEEASAELLLGHPLLERVYISKRRTWLSAFKKKHFLSTLREINFFLRDLREEYFDVILDLQGLLKSGLLVALAKGKRRIGFANHREGSTLPLTQKLSPYEPERHAVERYLDAALYLGGKRPSPVSFPLPPLPDPEDLREKFDLRGDLAVFIPRARWQTKEWTQEGWAELAHLVQEAFGLEIVLVGGVGDRSYVAPILEKAPFVRSLCGQTSILELAGLLKLARLIVTVDTGPMHLAVAVGKRVVALFGPTAPWRTGPFGQGHRVVKLDLPCSPCFKKKCPEPLCLKGLTPERVFQEVAELMINGGS